jgi:hypothetical protein
MTTVAQLEKRVAALESWRLTMEPPAVVVPAPPPPLESSPTIRNPASGTTIAHKRIPDVYGIIWNNGPDNVTIEDVLLDGCQFGLKLGASSTADNQSTGLKALEVHTKGCIMGAFLANLTDAMLTDWTLQSASSDPHNHALYLERGLYGLLIERLYAYTTGATGYCVNMYASGPFHSQGITIRNSTMTALEGGLGPLAINYPFRDVRLGNVLLEQKIGVARPVIMLGECSDVTIDGFTASGGNALIGAFGGTTPLRVKLRNGTWDGAKLPSFPWLDIDASVRLV